MGSNVSGKFLGAGVNAQGAYSDSHLKGANVEEVAKMFKEAPFDRFFETASTRDREVHAEGQRAKENPMGNVIGHIDLMETSINETGRDRTGVTIGSQFSGFLNGEATLRIEPEGDGVRVREYGTQVRPDMRKVPIAGAVQQAFEDTVPIAGPVAKAVREASEGVMGQVFQGVHALMSGRSAERMAKSINKKRRNGVW